MGTGSGDPAPRPGNVTFHGAITANHGVVVGQATNANIIGSQTNYHHPPQRHPPSSLGRAPERDGDGDEPRSRRDFKVAIICALPLEFDAVDLALDRVFDAEDPSSPLHGRAAGDHNYYTLGRAAGHNVVQTQLSRMGSTRSASAAASLRASFPGLRLALLVGVCGGLPVAVDADDADEPRASGSSSGRGVAARDIFLGDVVVSRQVVQYDFGRQLAGGFAASTRPEDTLRRPGHDVAGLLDALQTRRGRAALRDRVRCTLREIQDKAAASEGGRYDYPGASSDQLYRASYPHKHHRADPPCPLCGDASGPADVVCEAAMRMPCRKIGCEAGFLQRQRAPPPGGREEGEAPPLPAVHVGTMASANRVLRSASHRDQLARDFGAIGFEMEGAGVWEELPAVVVVKGVCDYADCHKHKDWQDYAAAAAASAAKGLLFKYMHTDEPAG